MPRILGYRQLWSEDRKLLVQVFTDPETDSIELVTVHHRTDRDGSWESVNKAEQER